MPKLEKIVIQDFRNIVLQELEFSPNLNCITGGNGEGKTNLLDAIWYLSMTKSAFGSGDGFNYRHGTSAFALSGQYSIGDASTRISMKVDEKAGKKIRRDDKPITKASDHIGLLPIVMVSPSDTVMISESGEERRRFANAVLSQMDREYLAMIQQYNRLLLQRNKLLRDGGADPILLDVIESRMDAAAAPVFEARRRLAEELLPAVARYYGEISGGRETVDIKYRSSLQKGSLAQALKDSRERDAILKYTSTGIQRDDFIFTMDGYPVRHCGSQGQQKSFLVALKFAQYEIMKNSSGVAPILLLDDLFDKLDMSRVANLLRLVSGNDFGQIFISDSNKVRTRTIVDEITQDKTYYVAEEGVFRNE